MEKKIETTIMAIHQHSLPSFKDGRDTNRNASELSTYAKDFARMIEVQSLYDYSGFFWGPYRGRYEMGVCIGLYLGDMSLFHPCTSMSGSFSSDLNARNMVSTPSSEGSKPGG